MARTRRQKLGRILADSSDLTYQQALLWLDRYTAAHGRLPRSEDELHRARTDPAAAVEPGRSSATAAGALVHVRDVAATNTFTLNYSALSRCPHLVMTVGHWLPGGVCAHAEPTCPTCQGRGQLATDAGPVTCGNGVGLPANVPVCDGTGTWTGART